MNQPDNTNQATLHPLGKTLRQLIASCPFDALAVLLRLHDDLSLAQYKEAYDILLNMEPSGNGCRDVKVVMTDWNDGEGPRLNAWNVEGIEWMNIIDGQVMLADDVDAPEIEIAHRLMWHLTFFGYCPEQTCLFPKEYGDTPYGKEARRIELHRYMLYANKPIRRRIIKSIAEMKKHGFNDFALSEDDWRYIHKRESHCNRSKRKRNYRLEQRIHRLSSLDHCETTVCQLLDGQTASTATTRHNLDFLFHTDERAGREMQSRTFGKRDRTEYILELINKYGALGGMPENRHIAMRIATSHDCPLTDNEREQICFTVGKVCNTAAITLCIAEDNNLGCEMSLLVVTNK
ncbi:MAG TPA: hypothetical protein DEQ27_07970 [Prevotella sp.]|nr:hypothetical protein [Prevotella sp.]